MTSSWKAVGSLTVYASELRPRDKDCSSYSAYLFGFKIGANLGVDRLEYLFPSTHAKVANEIKAMYPELFI